MVKVLQLFVEPLKRRHENWWPATKAKRSLNESRELHTYPWEFMEHSPTL